MTHLTKTAVVEQHVPDAGAGERPEPAGANRREHRRMHPAELRNLAARLASGAEIRLLDLSRGGAQFECDRRFLPNSTISLRLVTPDGTFVVTGHVVRSRIVRLERGGLGYVVAVAFNELLQNLVEEDPDPAALATGTASPASPAEPAEALAPLARSAALHEAADSAVEDASSDVSAEEAAAFEASVETAPSMLTVTTSVTQSGDELRDLFNGNDW